MAALPTVYFTETGKEITVRIAQPEDALALLELKLNYIKDTITIPMYEYEYKNDIAQEKQLIERYLNEDNSILLVAQHANTLIGNLDVTGSQRKKLFHTGMIGMGVAYNWQNLKIGSFLMESALLWATQNEHIKLLWLDVYSTNAPAIRLYEKFRFMHAGTIKNFVNDKEFTDKLTMVNYLK